MPVACNVRFSRLRRWLSNTSLQKANDRMVRSKLPLTQFENPVHHASTQSDDDMLQPEPHSQGYQQTGTIILPKDAVQILTFEDERILALQYRLQNLKEHLQGTAQQLDRVQEMLSKLGEPVVIKQEEEMDEDTEEIDSDDTDFSVDPYEVPLRLALSVELNMFIKVEGKVPRSTFQLDLPASRCSNLDDLRRQIVLANLKHKMLEQATGWEDGSLEAKLKDINVVTYRLEEDGHAATLTIAPTRINHNCTFPELGYEAWFYRNVLRGRLDLYRVDVYIEV